jgi:hypothetical protein
MPMCWFTIDSCNFSSMYYGSFGHLWKQFHDLKVIFKGSTLSGHLKSVHSRLLSLTSPTGAIIDTNDALEQCSLGILG